MKHILVLGTQVPFTRGGAELQCESLVREINKLDHVRAELVNLPYKWYPEEQILNTILAYRLLDLTDADGIKTDLVIAGKFPTYAVKHDNKVLWLIHQYRQMYDLAGTEFDPCAGDGDTVTKSSRIRNKIKQLDNRFFSECRKIYTTSETVSARLKKYNQFDSAQLPPPPALSDKIVPGQYGDYIFCVGRLDPLKRVDLLIKALSNCPEGKAVIAGKGPEYDRLAEQIDRNGLSDRCTLTGYIDDKTLIDYLSGAKAVYYAPLDEDFGYATIEAFLAKKPVITCHDSGEAANIVGRTGSGILCQNNAASLTEALHTIYKMTGSQFEEMSRKGHEFAKKIRWEEIIQKLVLDNLT